MKRFVFLLFLSTFSFTQAQEIACTDLLDFIEENGWKSSTVSSYTMNSSWLHRVTLYTYEYTNFVVAEIKTNGYSFNTKKYIFCGIPSYNWTNFKNGSYLDSSTHGERFHKYIIDYTCNCY